MEAYLYGSGVVLMSALYTLVHHTYFNGVYLVGMRVRIACSSLVYRKALKLSKSAMSKTTIGQMVNLLSNDVSRFDTAVIQGHYLWAGPLQLSIVTYLLYQRVGPSALVGVAFLLAFVPLQSKFERETPQLVVCCMSQFGWENSSED